MSLLPARVEPDLHVSFPRPASGYGAPRAALRREPQALASSTAGELDALKQSALPLSSYFLDELGRGSTDNYFCS